MGNPSEVYVMRSLSRERCLEVFAAADFDERLRPFRARALTDARLAAFLRELSEATELVSVDVQNRIRPPDDMLAYAELENDIVLYGSGLHFEVWSLARRPKQLGNEPARIGALAEVARELNF
jgi:DNA-binding transcriptional regulator/RsmH inhibitor MraZ